MKDGAEFTALLDLLAELSETTGDVSRRGESGSGPEPGEPSTDRRHGVLRQLRSDPEARLTLFRLALEVKRGTIGSERELRSELRAFSTAVEDRYGVDLLETAAANRDLLGDVPEELFDAHEADRAPSESD